MELNFYRAALVVSLFTGCATTGQLKSLEDSVATLRKDFESYKSKNSQTASTPSANISNLENLRKAVTESPSVKQDENDSEKSKKLLQLGVTLGTAVALQIPIPGATVDPGTQTKTRSVLKSTTVVAMPYLTFLPGYWFQPPEVRKYCASKWTGDQDAAENAAIAASRQWALRVVLASVDSINNGATDEQLTGWWADDLLALSEEDEDYTSNRAWLKRLVGRLRSVVVQNSCANADAGCRSPIEGVIRDLAAWRWDVGLGAGCVKDMFGGWIGFPAGFEGQIAKNDPVLAQFKPTIAVGLSFTPNSYVSLLLGATWMQVVQDNKRQSDISFNVALGGNLDIFTSIIGK